MPLNILIRSISIFLSVDFIFGSIDHIVINLFWMTKIGLWRVVAEILRIGTISIAGEGEV